MRILLRRFLGVWMAAVVSLCSVSGVTGMAEGNKGQAGQVKVKAEKITAKFPGSEKSQCYTDEDGNKVAYQWKSVSASGKREKICYSISVKQGKLEKKKIKFNKKTKQLVKKKDTGENTDIDISVEWQDMYLRTGTQEE